MKLKLLLGRKVITNLDSILKSGDITLSTKVHLVKAMVFPVVTCGCESWTIKKAEPRRIDAFELWCWRRLLRVAWAARRSNQSILKEISCGCSLKGLMLKLKLQYFVHLIRRTDSLEKTLMLGGIEGMRGRGWWRMRWLDGITNTTDMGLGGLRSWWWTGRPGMLQFMGLQRVKHDWETELNWTDHSHGNSFKLKRLLTSSSHTSGELTQWAPQAPVHCPPPTFQGQEFGEKGESLRLLHTLSSEHWSSTRHCTGILFPDFI